MVIILIDDLGNKAEFPDIDPPTPFIPTEHAVQCAWCHKYVLDEHAEEVPGPTLKHPSKWYCADGCRGEANYERMAR